MMTVLSSGPKCSLFSLLYLWRISSSTGGNGKICRPFSTKVCKPKMLWITEHAFRVVHEDGGDSCFHYQTYIEATIRATSGEDLALILVGPYLSDKSTAEVGVFWRAVATSNSAQLTIKDDLAVGDLGLPSGPLLSQCLRESSLLEVL
jgi:hypothetical protein